MNRSGCDGWIDLVRRVARHVPGLPWITVLDAVQESEQLVLDAPHLAPIVEAAAVARLRSGYGLTAPWARTS